MKKCEKGGKEATDTKASMCVLASVISAPWPVGGVDGRRWRCELGQPLIYPLCAFGCGELGEKQKPMMVANT